METIQPIRRVPGVETSPRSGLLSIFIRKPKRALAILVILVALALLAFFTLRSESPEENAQQENAQQELTSVVVAVGKLMVLPEGDEPVLATVTDAEALIAQQVFFVGTVDGDQLLLFPKSLKAIIYSPSRDKIINAGPIEQSPAENKDDTIEAKPVSSAAVNPSADTLTVEVRNGTETDGLAARIAEKVGAVSGFAIASVTDASKKDFTNTVIMSTIADARVAELAKTLGADVVETVASEKSSADVLVVVGADSGSY